MNDETIKKIRTIYAPPLGIALVLIATILVIFNWFSQPIISIMLIVGVLAVIQAILIK